MSRVPLSVEAAAALARARRIGEAYDLTPLPPGALALALVWDPRSAATRAFVGTSHDEVISNIQDDVLGIRLEGLRRLDDEAAAPDTRGLDDPPVLSDRQAMESLSQVTPLLPAWLLRLLAVAGVFGVWFSVVTAPSWPRRYRHDPRLYPRVRRLTGRDETLAGRRRFGEAVLV